MTDLVALAGDRQRPMPTFHPEMIDVSVQRGDPQPVQRQQRGKGVIPSSGQSGLAKNMPSSLRSSPLALDSSSNLGRSTWVAGETGMSCSSTQYR